MKNKVDVGRLDFVARGLLLQSVADCARMMRELADKRWPDFEIMAMAQTFGMLEDRLRSGVPFPLGCSCVRTGLEIALGYGVRFAPMLLPGENVESGVTRSQAVRQLVAFADRLGLDGKFVRSGALPLGA